MINLILLSLLFVGQICIAQSADYGGSSNATQLQGRVINAIAPTAGQVVTWNASTFVWEPENASSGTGTVSDIGTGVGLLGGPITTVGTLSVDVGTAANKIVQLTSTDQYPAVDGFLITNLSAVTLVGNGTGLLGGPITRAGTLSIDVGTTANKIVQLTTTGQLPVVDGFLLSNINAVKLQGFNVATSTPTANQLLTWNGTTTQWQAIAPATSGTVTSVGLVTPTWLTVSNSPITGSGALTITGTSEAQSLFVASPSGSSGAVSPRAIVAGDVPTLNQNTTGTSGNGYTTPTTGSNFLGSTASASLTNINVSATGVNAGIADTTGANNTFFGFNAGSTITTGSSNTIVGSEVGTASIVTTGLRNTFIGAGVTPGATNASDQVMIGNGVGAAALSSSGDVVIGSLAQGNLSNQTGNTTLATVSIGFSANGNASYSYPDSVTVGAFSNAGGNDSIVLGSGMQTNSADTFVAGHGGNTVSTNYVSTSAANQISFGSSTKALKDLFLGNGAVGIAAPSNISIQPTPVASGTSNTAGANLTLLGGNSTGTGAGGSIIFQTAPAGSTGSSVNTLGTIMTMLGSGNIGIGTTSPQAILDVTGVGTLQSAMILPRDSTTNRPSTAINGMVRYNTTSTAVEFYQNNGWASPLVNPMNTGGDIIYGGASGTPTRLANGSSGQVLESTGGTTAPAWTTLTAPTKQLFTTTAGQSGTIFTVSSANATVGATYTNNGNTWTVLATIASGTTLFASCSICISTGSTLTKSGGTGDSTITFSTTQVLATYTTPAGAKFLKVTVLGGGGGGGGTNSTATTNGAGGGGGGGGTVIKWISSPSATYYYSTGGAGAGGSSGTNDGSPGGQSSFNLTYLAGGGAGGRGATSAATATIFTGSSGQQGGGTASGGDLNINGGQGLWGFIANSTQAVPGVGGSSMFSGGALPTSTNGTGTAAGGYGGGGSGGLQQSNSGAAAGGNGTAGLVLVQEYYQ